MRVKTLVTTAALALATVAVLLWVAPVGAAGGKNPLVCPPNSHAYGYSLTEWLTIYWEWAISGSDSAQSKVGEVQLMPMPSTEWISGGGTPEDPNLFRGELAITVPEGTPIVLPEFAVWAEMYEDGSYDLPFPDDVVLANAHPYLTIDGVPVVTDANKADYYVPATYFDPPIYYPEPTEWGSVAAVFYQGVGVVIKPLPPGQHTIHLYEPWIFLSPEVCYWSLIYDNTWHVTVTAK